MAEDLNQDPGAPENTDPEATSAESAEAAAAEAAEAQGVDEGLADAEAAAADAEGVNPEDSNSIEAELAERTEDLQRVTAEYTNYRRRVERDRASVITGAKAEVAAELLPILDDLEMAE